MRSSPSFAEPIYSPVHPRPTAMIVHDDTIVWMGDADAADAHTDSVDVVEELDGALITPAFVDAHVHATSTGVTLTGLDLSSCRSLRDALDRVEAHSRAAAGRLLIGHGWDESRWPERRPPYRSELDRASYGGVVYLSRTDVHSAAISSALVAATPQIRALEGFDDGAPRHRGGPPCRPSRGVWRADPERPDSGAASDSRPRR